MGSILFVMPHFYRGSVQLVEFPDTSGRRLFGPCHATDLFRIAGTALVVIMHNLHYKWCKLLMAFLVPLSLVLMLWVDIFGSNVNDASRWLNIFGVSIQPSELAKLATIITLAVYIGRNSGRKRREM